MIVKKNLPLVFALLSVVAVCGCGGAPRADEQQETPAAMQRLLPKEVGLLAKSVQAAGGRTLLRPESGMVQVRFEDGPFGDADLASLEQLEFATAFNAPGAQITDAGLAKLAAAGQRIKTLDVTGNPITDVGLEHLRQIKALKFLVLDKTQVTAAGVEALQNALPDLTISCSHVRGY
jgi:hypothetical protein